MPRFVKAKDLLDGGAIGAVRAFRIENFQPAPIDEGGDMPWRVRPEVAGGGHFVDLGSHTLDLIDHLLGPVARVHGFAKNTSAAYPAEDLVSATFELGSAVVGTGLWCYAAGEFRDEVEIIGTDGQLTFSSFGEEPLRLRTAAGTEKIDAPYPATVQQPLIQTVVDELCGRGTSPSTGESAARTARVVDALLGSYRREHGISF
ncbi:Gfo/Idh/MocA family protein [Ruania zhangjianzhongii]|nr:Gfo/Idh/MocA family oxidoreductase [Ruania zhangjianzhongii]